jgi:hypothetical protein
MCDVLTPDDVLDWQMAVLKSTHSIDAERQGPLSKPGLTAILRKNP